MLYSPDVLGSMENISRSGVVFSAERLVEPGTKVQISFVLPAKMSGDLGAEVVSQGRVARTVPTSDAEAFPAVAATIGKYRLLRRDVRASPGP